MPILLYCIAKGDAPTTGTLTGIAGDPVVRVEFGGLVAYVSNNSDKSNWLRPPLQTSALEFHGVLSEVFSSTAIIPFRFPTIFDNEDLLLKRLRERSAEYCALLDKFSNLVQMELRITDPKLQKPVASGTEYLKRRQTATVTVDQFVVELRTALSQISQDWRQRASQEGIRAFVLIDRSRVADYGQTLRNVKIPRELAVRASGPWPISEFLEQS